MDVSVNGVVAVLLQLVGFDFVHQADAASLLVHVNEHTLTFLLNHLHCQVQLLAALAAHRPEDVTRGARRVYTHQDGLIGSPFALNQGNVLQAVVDLAERYELEMAVLCGQIDFVAHLNDLLGAQTIGNQVLDSDDRHIESLSHFDQLRQAGHGAVGIDDLDQGGSRVEAGNTHQVDGGLGVAGALEHALINGAQRVDVARTAEVLRLTVGIGQGADGHRAVVHRHAGGATVQQVDGYRERSAQHRCVVIDLHVQLQFMAALGSDGGAQHAASLTQHEINLFLGDFFGSDDKIAFVLTILVIDHDDKLAAAQLLHGLVNSIQFDFFHFLTLIDCIAMTTSWLKSIYTPSRGCTRR